jgi:hypothetical protein
LNFVDTNDISPVCENNPNEPHLNCDNGIIGGSDTGIVQEFIYQSSPIALPSVPPAGGWTFYWSTCCRNGSVTNLINPASTGLTIRAKMYSYHGKNTYPCFDSSPEFLEKPVMVQCRDYPYSFNANASDNNLDSLTYSWGEPLSANNSSVTFASGYSYDNPLPDSTEFQANSQPEINPMNGMVSNLSYTGGCFVVCNKVSSYRCGELISEVYREMEIILKSCRPLIPGMIPPVFNQAPVDSAPFIDYLGNPSYIDTVFAGDTVSFGLWLHDYDLRPDGNFQTLHITASGLQLAGDYITPNTCLYPPCATLYPNPATTYGQTVEEFDFNWVTTCDHLNNDGGCRSAAIHNFVFKAVDDFCPIPGVDLFTVTIVVLPSPGSPSGVSVIQSGDTLFSSAMANSYQWYWNDSAIAGANSGYFIPTDTGYYSVEAIPVSGCPARSEDFYFAPLAVYFPEFEMEFNVSPNPFRNTIQLAVSAKKPVPFQLLLTDVLGKTLSTWNVETPDRTFRESYDLSTWPAGMYLMQFRVGGQQKTFRLVKTD